MSELLSTLVAIVIAIISLPTYISYQNQSTSNLRAAAAAQQAIVFNRATSQYMQTYSTALQSVATAASPAVVTVAMLKATNVLDASFSSTNAYGQTWVLEVLQPTAGNFQALAMTTGGTAMRDKDAVKVAALVGQQGGFFPANDSGVYAGGAANAYGSYGGWQVSSANYTSVAGGHLASLIVLNNSQLADGRLYRNLVPGQSQLNQMNTPLIMASTQTLNASCSTLGAIAQDGNGVVLSCQGYTWQQQGSAYWKDPVASYAALPACTTSALGQTRVVETPTVGSGPRAYSCDGTKWSALAVDDTGSIVVAGKATLASLAGNLQLDSSTIVTAGSACPNGASDNGRLARDLSGMILSCQSGVWASKSLSFVTAAGSDPGCVGSAGWNAQSLATCPAGYTAVGGSFVQGSHCGYSTSQALAGMYVSNNSVRVWPQDSYAYTYVAYATCVK